MKRNLTINLAVVTALVGGLAACDGGSRIAGPDASGVDVDLMVDQDVTEASVADVEAALDAVSITLGTPSAATLSAAPDPETIEEARELLRAAREKFAEARRAWSRGDTELAAELAFEARLLVAEAIVLTLGEEGYERMLARVEQAISWLEQRVDQEPSELIDRIRELKEEAQALKDQDLVAATERLVLASQIVHRERIRHRDRQIDRHARLSVFMARSAVDLAANIAGDDATDRQIHALRHAQHLLGDAEAALQAGRLRLAHILSREVVSLSLLVVVLEPGSDGARLEAMIQLTERAISAAEEALVDQDPDSFAARLLDHARALQARALEIADTHPRRAIHVLWHAAVTAYGVIELVS